MRFLLSVLPARLFLCVWVAVEAERCARKVEARCAEAHALVEGLR